MKTALKAVGFSVVLVGASVLVAFELNAPWLLWTLWPGILFHRVAFRNYYAESHMVGWPSGVEMLAIFLASIIAYSLLAAVVIRLLADRRKRPSA